MYRDQLLSHLMQRLCVTDLLVAFLYKGLLTVSEDEEMELIEKSDDTNECNVKFV